MALNSGTIINAVQVRVATYNIHGCIGMDRRYAPARIASVISEIEPDIIALQEVDDRLPRCEGLTQFDYLRQATGMAAIAGPTLRDHRGQYGNAVLSRFPLGSKRRIDLSVPPYEPRGAIDVEVTLPAGRVRVIATHLDLRTRERKIQIQRLTNDLNHPAHSGLPTSLMGDFNEWLSMEGPRLRHLTGHFASRLSGPSFPSVLPLLRLDRIFALPVPDRVETSVHVSRTARFASDHLPVAAVISWTKFGTEETARPEETVGSPRPIRAARNG